MFNCSKLALAALGLASLANSFLIELKDGDHPKDFFPLRDFSIVNFYDSSEESALIKEVFEGSKKFVEDKIKTEHWHPREIQWLAVDIEKYPRLAFDDRGPTQLVFSNEIRLS